MKLIDNWQEKGLKCSVCKTYKSVKYEDSSGNHFCNLCGLREASKIDGNFGYVSVYSADGALKDRAKVTYADLSRDSIYDIIRRCKLAVDIDDKVTLYLNVKT